MLAYLSHQGDGVRRNRSTESKLNFIQIRRDWKVATSLLSQCVCVCVCVCVKREKENEYYIEYIVWKVAEIVFLSRNL